VRAGVALVVAVGLLASLAACSNTPAASACEVTPSGSISDAVKITGDIGAKPEVTFATPATVTETQRTVVTKGDGAAAADGDDVTVEYSIFSANTGDEVDATAYDGSDAQQLPLDGSLIAGFTKTLLCSTEGSRVVGVIAAADSLTADQLTQVGLESDDSLVLVFDVVTVDTPAAVIEPLPKSDGADQALPDGFPAISVSIADDADGTPTLVLPDGAAPTDLQLAVLKKGTGAVVGTGADVVVNYQGISWDTKQIFDQSWGVDGAAASPATFNTAQVIAGFTQALEGQTVGSQVLVVIPPALAYGEASDTNTSDLAGQTLVFIIDILGIA
jgi:peptidylprolyl isomerase